MFGKLFKKNNVKAPTWKSLDSKTRSKITKKILNMAGPQYKVVNCGFNELQRERAIVERRNEDEILNQYSRGRLLDMTRNQARNSATFQTILKQFDFNAVGSKGGKIVINSDDQQLVRELVSRFSEFTRNADFFDGLSFNQTLKLILKEALIGGDCCIIFDDGLIEDSGKILIYESDEIGNTTDAAIKQYYGDFARQSLGKVYSPNGRFIGAVVSRACRGEDIFDPNKSYLLQRDPNKSWFDSFWMMPTNVWRIAQGRGISQAASSIATINDLEDLCGFELQAAKKNSQTFAQIIHTPSSTDSDVELPSAFDSDTDFSTMTDDEIEQAIKEESKSQERTISFDKAASCGIVYEALPEDYKMELLSTNHPNEKVQEFIKWLAGRSSAVFGMSEAYATLMPTGADFRAQQLLTQPAFIEAQKYLETICDWVFYRFVNRLIRKGELAANRLPDNFMSLVSWSWPTMDELDEVAHENAIELKLRNLTGTYQSILGNNWREMLEQTKLEMDWCKQNNIPHPAFNLISGGERTGVDVMSDGTEV